jgi:hypothetical protein
MTASELKDTDKVTLRVERAIPLWGVLTGMGALIATGVSVIWHVADIAHDVATMRDVGVEIRAELKEENAQLVALDARLTRVETLTQEHQDAISRYRNEKSNERSR